MKLKVMALCALFFAGLLAVEQSTGWRVVAALGLVSSLIWIGIERWKID